MSGICLTSPQLATVNRLIVFLSLCYILIVAKSLAKPNWNLKRLRNLWAAASFCQYQSSSDSLAAGGRLCRVLRSQMRFLGDYPSRGITPPHPPSTLYPHPNHSPPIQTWRCVYNEIINICWCQHCTNLSA